MTGCAQVTVVPQDAQCQLIGPPGPARSRLRRAPGNRPGCASLACGSARVSSSSAPAGLAVRVARLDAGPGKPVRPLQIRDDIDDAAPRRPARLTGGHMPEALDTRRRLSPLVKQHLQEEAAAERARTRRQRPPPLRLVDRGHQAGRGDPPLQDPHRLAARVLGQPGGQPRDRGQRRRRVPRAGPAPGRPDGRSGRTAARLPGGGCPRGRPSARGPPGRSTAPAPRPRGASCRQRRQGTTTAR